MCGRLVNKCKERFVGGQGCACFHELALTFTVRGYDCDHGIAVGNIREGVIKYCSCVVLSLQLYFMGVKNRAIRFVASIIERIYHCFHTP